jgi:hypothetical protein
MVSSVIFFDTPLPTVQITCFTLEILGPEVGPISVTRMVYADLN